MKEITLFDQQTTTLSKIHHDGEMISLTDLWKEAGSPKNKDPKFWLRQDVTVQLIDALASMLNVISNHLLKIRRGKGGGTYAHKNLALAYAKYLDPKLHVLVNELFFQRVEEEKNPDLITNRAIRTYKKHGKSDEWIGNRLTAIGKRNYFTGTLKRHGVVGEGYKNCTNGIYSPLYGGSASVVREKKGLSPTDNIRDNLPSHELVAIMFAESLASKKIEDENLKGNAQCELACTRAAQIAANAVIQNNKKIG